MITRFVDKNYLKIKIISWKDWTLQVFEPTNKIT